MKFLALLLLALPAFSAPLPPFPTANRPTVVRSTPKRLQPAGIPPSTGASSFRSIDYTADIDFFGCAGQPGCQLYDSTHISINHAEGVQTIVEASDVSTPTQWVQIASLPPSMDELVWYEPSAQRHPQRFFRLRDEPLGTTVAARKLVTNRTKTFGLTSWKRPSPLKK